MADILHNIFFVPTTARRQQPASHARRNRRQQSEEQLRNDDDTNVRCPAGKKESAERAIRKIQPGTPPAPRPGGPLSEEEGRTGSDSRDK